KTCGCEDLTVLTRHYPYVAYRAGDTNAYTTARSALRNGIRSAKLAYKSRIEAHFNSSTDPRQVWEGIRAITDYKGRTSPPVNGSDKLAEELNTFYTRFDRDNKDPVLPPLPSDGSTLVLSEHDVRLGLRSINARKAAGPDGVQGRVLKGCAAELAPVFTTIFNLSLATSWVPACLKAATIVPVPRKPNVTSLNDYRPVALTPIVAKCLERLVMKHIKSAIPPSLDPYQFAYRQNRWTEDAIAIVLHTLLEHLEHKSTYARLLFVDFSSAFNTILPNKLHTKLHNLGLSTTLCNWTLDFLINSTQHVRIGKHISPTLPINTGGPQGCVLSPLLYTLLTHDCCSSSPSNLMVKFADDTSILGLITNHDESAYRGEVEKMVAWCGDHNLVLNTSKTKEMIIDFRRTGCLSLSPLLIGNEEVERVSSFKFLGVTVADDLSWTTNTTSAVKKAQQRLFYLRKLKWAKLPQQLMVNFYHCAVECPHLRSTGLVL
ncbi:MAG: reverse transcriptase domain-containing protein, partial [Bacteroidota bacterium]